MFEALEKRIAEKREAYQAVQREGESQWRPLSDEIKRLQRELQDEIAKGARPCKDCGSHVMGMKQPKDIGPRGQPHIITLYEVGCAGKCPTRVLDVDRDKVIARWNQLYGKPE